MKDITFNEENHTYTTVDGELYTSCTTLLGRYTKPFNTERMAGFTARKRGIDVEDVLAEWKHTTDYACRKGTAIHLIMENYINGIVDDKYSALYKTYESAVISGIGVDIKKTSAEVLLSNDEYKIAGLADIVYEIEKNQFIIGDYKTNKKFTFFNKYNEYLLKPLNHLQNSKFNMYAMQMSIYAWMYEVISGKKCAGLVIYYLERNGWKPINMNYMKMEVDELLRDFGACD